MGKIAMSLRGTTGILSAVLAVGLTAWGGVSPAVAQEKKPNIVMLMGPMIPDGTISVLILGEA